MGRKPYASKLLEKAPVPETTNPSLERSELLPRNSQPSLNKVESQLENHNIATPTLKCTNPPVEGMVLQNEKSPAEEQENTKSGPQEKSYAYKRKKPKHSSASVRRSERVKTAVLHAPNQDIEPYAEDVTVIDNEKDELDTQTEKELSKPEADLSETSLEEKFDYILQRLEALEKTVESLQPKVDENVASDEIPSSESLVFRSLYLDSQKKVEALTDENRQLTGKLENALGKIEVMEKQSSIFNEVLEKVKDVLLVCSVAKSTEAVVNASTQAIQNACAASASKRKRQAHEN